ncbi:hypothetical protein [Luteibacter sp. Lutesp34]|uniref:hypothetical protein n=1 Tax=Luteibacter sp. Lutesp34 TaxID=3243030 RepID=UPI0039B36736
MTAHPRSLSWLWMLLSLTVIAVAYFPGISGSWIFDDYPNIVDNKAVQPSSATLPLLTAAALSSPSSEFKRPLASLSFAANYLASGLDPKSMKATNVAIHLANGLFAFLLIRLLMAGASRSVTSQDSRHAAIVAFLWMALPINLTAVLYVVQRMEALANLFVLAGLLGYVVGRRQMLTDGKGFLLTGTSVVMGTVIGTLGKETAVLTPLYALLIEIFIFGWKDRPGAIGVSRRMAGLFLAILAIPLIVGSIIVMPRILADAAWASRPFTIDERLLSECRIVALYLRWTLFPTPSGLSFYHDDFVVSTGWLSPWTTLASGLFLAALAALAVLGRRRWPLISLGITWFFACHLLTGTIIPLELVYEHRNYFSSLGIVVALVSAIRGCAEPNASPIGRPLRPRDALLVVAGVCWLFFTAFTAYRWGGGLLRLPEELAIRAPASPRAQYELGRTYVIMTRYRPDSPYRKPAYDVLERAAAIPGASTLPEQALIFLNARMNLPVKDAWWDSMRAKLQRGPVAVEDESAIIALTTCRLEGHCQLSSNRLLELYVAALSHPRPRARLIGSYSDFAWSVLEDKRFAYQLAQEASSIEPSEPAYHVTVVKQALAMGDFETAERHIAELEQLNIGDRLESTVTSLRTQMFQAKASVPSERAVK